MSQAAQKAKGCLDQLGAAVVRPDALRVLGGELVEHAHHAQVAGLVQVRAPRLDDLSVGNRASGCRNSQITIFHRSVEARDRGQKTTKGERFKCRPLIHDEKRNVKWSDTLIILRRGAVPCPGRPRAFSREHG